MNQIYKIEKLDHQGRGIIKGDPIIFVEDALPTEEVAISIFKQKKKIWEAKAIAQHKKSLNRVIPLCPYYTICGGCHIMHLNYAAQCEWKEQKVKEIINKFGKLDVKVCKIVPSSEWHYRNKATFQVQKKLGYFKKNSYELVPIDKCLIVNNKMNEVLKVLNSYNLEGCKQVMIRVGNQGEECMIQVKGNPKFDLASLKPYATSIWKNDALVYGNSHIVETLGDKSFYISPDSFFQVNTAQAKQLYDQIVRYAELKAEDVVLDLYCGTGSIGIYLSSFCKKVIGIELNESAITDAKKNLELNRISHVEFICGDVANKIDLLTEKYDVVIVDPPRSGLDEKTISALKEWQVDRLIYVSCDPVTLARDLKKLSECYEIKEITPVDLFPQTYHVECVCLLNRR